MKIPDLAEMIDEWETAHTYEVMEITMEARDKLFKQDSKRMAEMIAAMYQVPSQLLKAEGKATTWPPILKPKKPYQPKST